MDLPKTVEEPVFYPQYDTMTTLLQLVQLKLQRLAEMDLQVTHNLLQIHETIRHLKISSETISSNVVPNNDLPKPHKDTTSPNTNADETSFTKPPIPIRHKQKAPPIPTTSVEEVVKVSTSSGYQSCSMISPSGNESCENSSSLVSPIFNDGKTHMEEISISHEYPQVLEKFIDDSPEEGTLTFSTISHRHSHDLSESRQMTNHIEGGSSQYSSGRDMKTRSLSWTNNQQFNTIGVHDNTKHFEELVDAQFVEAYCDGVSGEGSGRSLTMTRPRCTHQFEVPSSSFNNDGSIKLPTHSTNQTKPFQWKGRLRLGAMTSFFIRKKGGEDDPSTVVLKDFRKMDEKHS